MKITGSDHSDTLYGSKNEDIIRGYGGDDLIFVDAHEADGATITDHVYAGAGDDMIRGLEVDYADRSDFAKGEDDETVIDGGKGRDVVVMHLANTTTADNVKFAFLNQIYRFSGVETFAYNLAWMTKAPTFTGTDWNETFTLDLYGTGNKVVAGGGNDVINIVDGSGKFSGGAGKDLLISSFGENTLSGGTGKDVFLFQPSTAASAEQADTSEQEALSGQIEDFHHGKDSLILMVESVTLANLKNLDADTMLGHSRVNFDVFNKTIDYNANSGAVTYKGDFVTSIGVHQNFDFTDVYFL
jgi:Ca2+-binding RTX toxin-like protein